MNIKKAQDILKRWLGNRPSDQYVSYQALDSIIAALDSPIEHQHIWVKSNCAGIVCMTCGITQKEAECTGFVSMKEFNREREENIRKRDRIDKYYASCEKIREILKELSGSVNPPNII